MPDKMIKEIRSIIKDGSESLIRLLSDLVSFKTVTPGEDGLPDDYKSEFLQCASYLKTFLEALGFETEVWEVEPGKLVPGEGVFILSDRNMSNMPVVTAIKRGSGGGKSIILNGHYDVVSPGLLSSWNSDPFKLTESGNILYGRGVSDMKGGIAALLFAVKSITEAEIQLKGDIIIEIVPDEEFSSMGTLACCQRGIRADAGIIPEATNWKTYIATRGNLTGRITVRGRAAHADYPQPPWEAGGGVNSIEKACIIVSALYELNQEWKHSRDREHPFLPPDSITVTMINGGEWEISYPEKTEIFFTCNFIPGNRSIAEEIKDKVLRAFSADSWMAGHPPVFDFDDYFYASEISADEEIVKTVAGSAEELGLTSVPGGDPSLTDIAHLINAAGVPSVAVGPSDESIHKSNENMKTDDLLKLTELLSVSVLRWTL